MFVSSRNHYRGASAPSIVIGRLNQYKFYQSYPDVPVCQSVPYILCTFRVCHSCVSVCSNRQPSSARACRTTHTLYITCRSSLGTSRVSPTSPDLWVYNTLCYRTSTWHEIVEESGYAGQPIKLGVTTAISLLLRRI